MPREIYPGVRRAEVRQNLDRETWADYKRTVFPVAVNGSGEYLTPEPIMFGQAYEEPPFFTFSVVGDTIINPEVKAIGWPTFEPCKEVGVNSGAQILLDGSFENFISSTGSAEVPVRNFDDTFSRLLLYQDLTFLPWRKGMWAAHDDNWTIVEGDADTGDRYAHWADVDIGGFLEASQYRLCSEFRGGTPPWYPVDWEPWLYTGRAELGQTINVTFRARGSAGQQIHTVIEPWREDGAFQNEIDPAFLEDHPITTSWATYEVELQMPGSATEPRFLYIWSVRAMFGGTLDIDSVVISQT